MAANTQTVFFSIEADGVSQLVDQLALAKREAAALQKEMRGASSNEEYVKLNRTLENNRREQAAINAQIKESTKSLREQTTFAVGSYREMNAALGKLRAQYKDLSDADRNGLIGTTTLKNIQQLDRELKDIDKTLGQFQRNVGNYPKGLDLLGLAANGASGQLGSMLGTIGSLGAAGPIGAAVAGVGALGTVAVDATQKAVAFEDAVAQMRSTLGLAPEQVENLRASIQSLQEIALSGGAQIVSSGEEIAKALTIVGSKAPQLLEDEAALAEVTKQVIVLSKAAGTDLETAAQTATQALNQFGLSADQTARVINVLSAAEVEGSSTINQTSAALEEAGTVAKIAGISIEETAAAIQQLASSGIAGSEAGTALKNVFATLESASGLPQKALDTFEKAGVDVKILEDNTKPLGERLKELSKIGNDAANIVSVFGKENLAAAAAIIANVDNFDELTQSITGTNAAYDQAAILQSTVTAKIENAGKRIDNALTSLGQALLPVVNGFLDGFDAVLDTAEDLGTAIGSVGDFVSDLIPDSDFLTSAFENMGRVLNFIVTGPFTLFRAALKAIPSILAGAKSAIEAIPQAITGFVEDSITSLLIFAVRAKGVFDDAVSFFTGAASQATARAAQIKALEDASAKRQANRLSLAQAYTKGVEEFNKQQAESDKAAAAATVAAEAQKQNALGLTTEQLEASEKAQKDAEAAAKKAAEEAQREAELRLKTLSFLQAQLAKVRAELATFSDPNLIPEVLFERFDNLSGAVKRLEDRIKAYKESLREPVKVDALTARLPEFEKQAQQFEQVSLDGLRAYNEKIQAQIAEARAEATEKLRENATKAAIDLATQVTDALFTTLEDADEKTLAANLERLTREEERRLQVVAGNVEAEKAVRREFELERQRQEKAAFEEGKRRAIGQALINAALAVTNALATTQPLVPAGIIAAAAVAAATAVQVASIAAQQFALGGLIPRAERGIIVGPSHANGGVPMVVNGRAIEAEGGEYMQRNRDGSVAILNKQATRRFGSVLRGGPVPLPMLSAMNVSTGGVPYYAMGGVVAPVTNTQNAPQDQTTNRLLLAIAQGLQQQQIVLPVSQLENTQNRQRRARAIQGL